MTITPSLIVTIPQSTIQSASSSAINLPISIPIKLISSQSFDWLTFFWGGAVGSFVGAFVILTMERILDLIITKIKSHQEKHQITHALNTEIQSNLDLCELIIGAISRNTTATITYTNFEYTWNQTYSNRIIDFSNQDSLRLYSFLYGARNSIDTIHALQANLQMFSASSRALSGYHSITQHMNQNILQFVQRLKSILEEIKSRRHDNKIFYTPPTQ
jgi:hypothetical protein